MDLEPLLPEVDTIAGTEIQPQLRDAFANRLDIAEEPFLQAINPHANSGSGLYVQSAEPFSERFPSLFLLANKNLSRRGFQICLRARPQCDI